MTELEQLKAQIALIQAENAALKQAATSKLTFKVSEKGAVSVYGLGRFPATLYAGQWLTVLDNADRLKAFIMANHAYLKTKAEKAQAKTLTEHQEGREADGLAN